MNVWSNMPMKEWMYEEMNECWNERMYEVVRKTDKT